MIGMIEEFSKTYESTIALVEAISTFAAVVISLVLALDAQKANKTQIKISVSIKQIIHKSIDARNPPEYLVADITNTGLISVRIPLSFFHWKVPFYGGFWMILPHDYSAGDALVPQQQYPVEIPPKASHTFFLANTKTLRQELKRMLLDNGKIGHWRWHFVYGRVLTDEGRWFRATINANVKKEFQKVLKTSETPPKQKS